jgi:hypothetical protein
MSLFLLYLKTVFEPICSKVTHDRDRDGDDTAAQHFDTTTKRTNIHPIMPWFALTDMLENAGKSVAGYDELFICEECHVRASHCTMQPSWEHGQIFDGKTICSAAANVKCENPSCLTTWWVCFPCKKVSKTWGRLRKHRKGSRHQAHLLRAREL